MGKKRRILTRTTKFAKKYFEFLDKVDRTANTLDAADDILERVDPFIDTISIVDNGNQTITVTGRVLGDVAGMGDDKVQVKVGTQSYQDSGQINAGGTGLDKYTYSFTSASPATGLVDGASYAVKVRPKGSTATAVQKSGTTEVIKQNVVNIQASAFTAIGGSQIRFTKANLFAATPGKKTAGSGADADLTNIAFVITVKKDGGANTATLLNNNFDAGQNGAIAVNDWQGLDAQHNTVLASAAAGTYTFTLTPKEAAPSNRLLTDSAITFDVVVS